LIRLPFVFLVITVMLAGCGDSPAARIPSAAPAAVTNSTSTAPSPTLIPTPEPRPSPSPTPEPPRRAELVRTRGQLVCGVEGERPGFALAGEDGTIRGLDVDICRAVATAVLSDANAVEVRSMSRRELLVGLKGGAIDMLGSTAILSSGEALAEELAFAPVTFDDGMAVMTSSAADLAELARQKTLSVCVERDSPAEQALAAYFLSRNRQITTVVFEDPTDALHAYTAGDCAGVAGPRSDLASERQELNDPSAHLILDELLTSAPRAPAVLGDDPQWLAIVSAVVSGTMQADSLGISSENLDRQITGDDLAVRQLLGATGDAGKRLGLPHDFVARVIRALGNYGEIYDRNLGPATSLDLPRPRARPAEGSGVRY